MKPIIVAVALSLATLAAPAVSSAFAQDMARTQQLEEQVRQLTGRVEELSYQLLQMEERMRKMQEDNEFRFQELEESNENPQKTDAEPSEGKDGLEKPDAAPSDRAAAEPASRVEDEARDGASAPARKRVRPKAEATLRFDDEGKLVAGPSVGANAATDAEKLAAITKPPTSPFATVSEAAFAAAAFGSTPDAVFARGRELFRSQRYGDAAKAFRAHVGAWPKDDREAEARYWLGQSLFSAGDYYAAASALLDAHNRFPRAKTAPDALLALGLSLAGLEQREVACATYAEVVKQYPEAEKRLGEQVRAEQAAARC